jgi:LmbE family N-acetylglucosaminyl deacetylase
MADAVPEMREWGLPAPGELDAVVVLSPHLDDAVLGCGRLLSAYPGATVVTLYAGAPEAYPDPMTHWDTLAGFGPGDDVLARRREEDAAALAILDATPLWLDFVEHQYLPRAEWVGPDHTVDRLEEVLRGLAPTAVLLPFGLANPDHAAAHEAGLRVRERYDAPAWLCYEDTGYKHIPGMLAWRVSQLFRRGLWPTPVAIPVDADDGRKRAALDCYRSQLLALEADWQVGPKLVAPEQVWRLAPPPSGWEGLTDA